MSGSIERRQEIERRFYDWSRMAPRYKYMGVTVCVALLFAHFEGVGDAYLYLMIAVMCGYAAVAILQLFSCRKEASQAFPPDVR